MKERMMNKKTEEFFPRGEDENAPGGYLLPNRILDNQGDNLLGDFLRRQMTPGSRISIASAFFSIGAYRHLRDELESAAEFRFLYGDSPSEDVMPTDRRANRIFDLCGEHLSAAESLSQSILARGCEKWLRRKASKIRTVAASNFMHGKMFHIRARGGEQSAVVGSSNFTASGLGFGARKNIELNLSLDTKEARQELLDWFEKLWNDDSLTKDIKQKVLDELRRLYEHCPPEMLYFKTLFHIFHAELDALEDSGRDLEGTRFKDSAVWKKLYPFQKDGVRAALMKLNNRGGCIIADSVGLGKTFEALAVIKYFELRNKNALVLCPKRLMQNWEYYAAYNGIKGNPLEDDRFNYTVRAHTDLSRDLDNFNWSNYDLVVIDESHHFRNALPNRTDVDGNVIRHSRYRRLLDDVIKKGVRTKVLMLSATPVNNTLSDLGNQIALITEGQDGAFSNLGIRSLKSSLTVAQRKFNDWQKAGRTAGNLNKSELLEKLDADFIRLLDAVSIARSRAHIKEHYKDATGKILSFPTRQKPMNVHPETDLNGAISYEDIHRRIGEFGLSVYKPSAYLIPQAKERREKEEKQHGAVFTQAQRENFLIYMMRVGFLKRLESSAHSFAHTMRRTTEKIGDVLHKIEKYRTHRGNQQIADTDAPPELIDDAEEEYGEFVVGKRLEYTLSEIDIDRWQSDLEADKNTLSAVLQKAMEVTPQRDGKLQELKKHLREKIDNPPADKNGNSNYKALVFTAYADTAHYLYDNLLKLARDEFKVNIALVTGGDGCKTTFGRAEFNDILNNFSPISRERSSDKKDEIDIVIATDCVAEGQNLQDCDLVINYDIHWNPVRLVQRFGRIDRIGGRGESVRMINFWPKEELDQYLNLTWRVNARMALADISATQSDDVLQSEDKDKIKNELQFRDKQLLRLRDEVLDLDEMTEGVAMSDLTLDSFRGELLRFLEANRDALEKMPLGMHAVVSLPRDLFQTAAAPGVIFCLKLKGEDKKEKPQGPNPAHPHFLAYVRDDGEVRYSFASAAHTLGLFQALCAGKKEAEKDLCNAFDGEIDQPGGLKKYDQLLQAMTRDIRLRYGAKIAEGISGGRDGIIPPLAEQPKSIGDFQLITWLIIKEAKK